ncbi:MAG: hypothetical protein V9E90_10670 [Saprospiraceae bacterium]
MKHIILSVLILSNVAMHAQLASTNKASNVLATKKMTPNWEVNLLPNNGLKEGMNHFKIRAGEPIDILVTNGTIQEYSFSGITYKMGSENPSSGFQCDGRSCICKSYSDCQDLRSTTLCKQGYWVCEEKQFICRCLRSNVKTTSKPKVDIGVKTTITKK